VAITHLTDKQVAEVLAPSKRYEADAYREVFSSLSAKAGDSLAHIETAFPGVKPAHVVFMLKQLRGDAGDLVIDSHATHGVCVIPVTPKAAKPTKKGKKATKKGKSA
jgi:hypothetical protein